VSGRSAAGGTGATERLDELGIALPDAPAPAAAYLPYVVDDGLVYTAGQIAVSDGELVHTGRVGDGVDLEQAQACARQCAINVLAQLRAAADGDLDRIRRIVKLSVFVASVPGFVEQHLVANTASELMAGVFGDAGRHARSAVGVAELPTSSPVEIEAVARLA
jgi:enamine deaminase RidA (YjgF/YER057c/UK114 family)